jgi:type III restriction enzyme
MLSDTTEAEDIGHWLRDKYPENFAGKKTLIIHTNKAGEITKADLDEARKAAREVDDDTNPINAIVSVLMLREGWDVQNVTVVVASAIPAKANILPEQTIGRGLRLMFRSGGVGYLERVDIIGNKAFLEFVDDLEKLEDLTLETFEIGKDKVRILTIAPQEERKEFDIAIPQLTPSLVRKKSLAEEIAALEVMKFGCPPLPLKEGDAAEQNFMFEGYDILTLKKELEREYTLPDPQTAQEVIGYYARIIAKKSSCHPNCSVSAR